MKAQNTIIGLIIILSLLILLIISWIKDNSLIEQLDSHYSDQLTHATKLDNEIIGTFYPENWRKGNSKYIELDDDRKIYIYGRSIEKGCDFFEISKIGAHLLKMPNSDTVSITYEKKTCKFIILYH